MIPHGCMGYPHFHDVGPILRLLWDSLEPNIQRPQRKQLAWNVALAVGIDYQQRCDSGQRSCRAELSV